MGWFVNIEIVIEVNDVRIKSMFGDITDAITYLNGIEYEFGANMDHIDGDD